MLLSAVLSSLGLSFVFALGGVGAAAALVQVFHSIGMMLSAARPLGLLINTLSLSGATYINIRKGEIRLFDWWSLIGASIISAPVGAYVSVMIPEKILLLVFGLFLAISGLVMLSGKKTEGGRETVSFRGQLVLGALSGFISGLLGVGSGGVIVPVLGLLKFQPKRIAVITALTVPVSSFSGFLAYLQMSGIDWRMAVGCGVAALVGGLMGTRFMHQRLSQTAVRKFLALILIAMAVKIIFI
ncbi:sulfite exporter TauE/SafE family protein [Desulfovibrio sp. JC010]|uniref:sulfite exporter TauE/SafE family protein n=1 Tax=Desulfovibrio sp. JC010 TaxID=2593641 RepID=UPI0013D1239E|nr:sulfite exporter TauE/SafE family protein [Desulfovibrio sp. JC010]NDV25070.1 sulfite exporter TauE/SafE family protein [Desulfovibrio sp. JC010]